MALLLLGLTLIMPGIPALSASAVSPFDEAWNRTDLPVADGTVHRTWIWGDSVSEVLDEDYADAPGGSREVQYFDKSRMEINDPEGDSTSPWFVTNGLLVVELISGHMQVGDERFIEYVPSEANVAGDQDIGFTVKYYELARHLDAPPRTIGAVIAERMSSFGLLGRDAALADYGVTAGHVDPVTNHGIATPFWEFMNSDGLVWDGASYVVAPLFANPYFATGRPITEAYWTNTRVAGTHKMVLFQCFERRCLTYTPDNPPGWQVEAGNVGQHYFHWRSEMLARPDASGYGYTGTLTSDGIAMGSAVSMQEPAQVAVASDGTVYVADSRNEELLTYSPDGELSAQREFGPHARMGGLALDDQDNLLVTVGGGMFQRLDSMGHTTSIFALEQTMPQDSFLIRAGFGIDRHENIYLADRWNDLIRKFNATGELVGLIVPPELEQPIGVAVGPDGMLYVATFQSNLLHVIRPDATYAGAFEATGCLEVTYVATDRAGHVYAACEDAVVKLTSDGTRLFALGGHGVEVGKFDGIEGVAIGPDGRIFVTDAGNARVQVFDSDGEYLYSSPDPPSTVVEGGAVKTDDQGRIYVTGGFHHADVRVRVHDHAGKTLYVWEPRSRKNPRDLAPGPGNSVYLLYQEAIEEYAIDGAFVRSFPIVADEHVKGQVWAIEVDSDSNVYILDSGLIYDDQPAEPSAILKYDPDGQFVARWESDRPGFEGDVNYHDLALEGLTLLVATYEGLKRLDTATGEVIGQWPGLTGTKIAVDGNGNFYLNEVPGMVGQFGLHIAKYAPDGRLLAGWGLIGSGEGEVRETVRSLAVDPSGTVYAVDYLRVQRFSRR